MRLGFSGWLSRLVCGPIVGVALWGWFAASAMPSEPPSGLTPFKKIGVDWPIDQFAWMSFVSFKPDGNAIASDASADGGITGDLTLWSFPDGRLIKRLPGQPVAISPDWNFYATAHGVRRIESGEPVISLGDNVYAHYAFSPDGRRVAQAISVGPNAPATVLVIDLKTKAITGSFGKHRAFALAISPDGKRLATGHWNMVTLWNLDTGRREAALHGTGGYASGLAFSRDGQLLAVGTDRGGLQIWKVKALERLKSLQLDGGDVQPSFSPDGRLVAAGVYGAGAVWIADVETGRILDHRQVSALGCGSVAFSPDGRFLATPSTGGLIRWPYDLGGTIRVFRMTNLKTGL